MSLRQDNRTRLKLALELASDGCRIVPVVAGLKMPFTTSWPESATSDAQAIRAWFEDYPNMNYGVVGGAKSGLFILDCDLYKLAKPQDGWLLSAKDTYSMLLSDYGPDVENTFSVRTSSGGLHHYFEWPEGMDDDQFPGHSTEHVNLGRGMDVAAWGGMVVGPGSVVDGVMYEAIDPDAEFKKLPIRMVLDLQKSAEIRITERSRVKKAKTRATSPNGIRSSAPAANPAWVRGALHGDDGIMKKMLALSSSEGSRDDDSWNSACQIAGFVNAPGANLSATDGFDLFMSGLAHLVSDDFTVEVIAEKWGRALLAAEPVRIPEPKRRPGPVPKDKSIPDDEADLLYEGGVLITRLLAAYIVDRWNIKTDETGSLWFYDTARTIFRPLNGSDEASGGARADIARVLLNDNSFSLGRVKNVIDAISATSHVLPKFDPDRGARYIPFKNGVLDRTTREFLQHSSELSSTFVWGITYDASARCPANDKQIELTMAPDAHDYYWEFMASMLFPSKVGATQKAWVLYGTGNEGKSTCMETVRRLLGGDGSVSAIPLHDLNASKIFRVAELRGKRANIMDDVSKMPIRDSAVLKSLILGEPVYSERKNEHGKHFRFVGSMAFGSNHVFNSPEGGEAWFRRFMYLHFPNKMNEVDAEHFDEETLRTDSELSGVFNKALEAADRLDKQGFSIPDSARCVEKMFQNPGLTWRINQWLEDADGNLNFQATGDRTQVRIKTGDAWKAFETWASAKGIPENELPTRNKGFHPYMRLRFVEKKFEQGGRHYLGLSLTRKLRAADGGPRARRSNKVDIQADPLTGEVLSLNRLREAG
jgi:P4 family phage/plasmid primase-like protien